MHVLFFFNQIPLVCFLMQWHLYIFKNKVWNTFLDQRAAVYQLKRTQKSNDLVICIQRIWSYYSRCLYSQLHIVAGRKSLPITSGCFPAPRFNFVRVGGDYGSSVLAVIESVAWQVSQKSMLIRTAALCRFPRRRTMTRWPGQGVMQVNTGRSAPSEHSRHSWSPTFTDRQLTRWETITSCW